jgi:hypothetical protein
VDAYESKNQELMTENADLRALLRSMQVYVYHSTSVVMVTILGFPDSTFHLSIMGLYECILKCVH